MGRNSAPFKRTERRKPSPSDGTVDIEGDSFEVADRLPMGEGLDDFFDNLATASSKAGHAKLTLKAPQNCSGLDEIRVGIDTIDNEIVAALARRMAYVKAASRFKPAEESIAAPERVAMMLAERRSWAEHAGLDPDFVESFFATMIAWFIKQQTGYWRTQRRLD